jgi:hypothetical protein
VFQHVFIFGHVSGNDLLQKFWSPHGRNIQTRLINQIKIGLWALEVTAFIGNTRCGYAHGGSGPDILTELSYSLYDTGHKEARTGLGLLLTAILL